MNRNLVFACAALALSSCSILDRSERVAPAPRTAALVSLLHDGAEVANSNRDRRFVPEVYCLRDYALTGDVFAVPDGFPARLTVSVSERWRPVSAEVILYGGSFTDTDQDTVVRSDVREGQNVEIATRAFEPSIAPRSESLAFSVVPISGTRLFGRSTVKISAQITDDRGEVARTSSPIIGAAEDLCGPQ